MRSATSSGLPVSISAWPAFSGAKRRRTSIPAAALRAHRNFLDAARLLGLTDAGDGGVAGRRPGRLHADHGRQLHFEAGRLAAAELLADLDRVVLALDGDDDADVGPAQRRAEQRRELAVEIVDRLHAGQHEVDLLS